MTTIDPPDLTGPETLDEPKRPPCGVPTSSVPCCGCCWSLSAVGNMVTSSIGAPQRQVHLACGAVTALCVTALVAHHLRGRR